ncbi:MAG: DUF192 domain-containing protein [Thermoproteota archaeon]|nr:DUF192 domain-containing protein [Thermoproteota archaeon]
MTKLLLFLVIGVTGSIVAGVVLYFFAGILTMLAGQESQFNRTIIQEQIRSGIIEYPKVNITINDQTLVADVSATTEQRTLGLTVKNALAENEAMLFVFENEAKHKFWMKDMKFPIDIIWISDDKRVVDIENNLQPCNSGPFCSTYEPEGNSLYVLETASGLAQKFGIAKGSLVKFELNSQNPL